MIPTDDSENYKYGLFYFNRGDKRIIVPKRMRYLGWTLNFAQPGSYLFVIALIGLVFWLKTV